MARWIGFGSCRGDFGDGRECLGATNRRPFPPATSSSARSRGHRRPGAGCSGRSTTATSSPATTTDCRGDLIDIAVTPDAGGECSEAMLAERVGLGHPGAFDEPEFADDRPAGLHDQGCADRYGVPQLDRLAGPGLHCGGRRSLHVLRRCGRLPRDAAEFRQTGPGIPERPCPCTTLSLLRAGSRHCSSRLVGFDVLPCQAGSHRPDRALIDARAARPCG